MLRSLPPRSSSPRVRMLTRWWLPLAVVGLVLGTLAPLAAEEVVETYRSPRTLVSAPVAIAVNPTDHSVWTADTSLSQLIHLDQNGNELWRGSNYPGIVSLAVNASDGSCWMAMGSPTNQVRHVSAAHVLLHTITSGGARCVAVGPSGDCWVAEELGNSVARIRANGTVAWRRTGLASPWGVSVRTSDSTCWVANTGSNTVLRLDGAGVLLRTLVGFNSPRSVAMHQATAQVYVADTNNNRIVRFNPDGSGGISYSTGLLTPQYLCFNNSDLSLWVTDSTKTIRLSESLSLIASATGFYSPRQVSVDTASGTGHAWVADCWNNQVVKLQKDGTTLFRSWVGHTQPVAMAVNPQGGCWVAEQGANRVSRVAADGTITWRTATGLVPAPRGVAVNPANDTCWVAHSTNSVSLLSSTGTRLALASLPGGSNPVGIACLKSDGSCWVTEEGTGGVDHISTTGSILLRIPGFAYPEAVDVSQAEGWIVVADMGGNRVYCLNSNGSVRWSRSANAPTGVAVAQDGTVWIAENGSSQVTHVDTAGALIVSVPGMPGPRDVSVAGDGTVWVACSLVGRVAHLASDGTVLWLGPSAGYPMTVAAGMGSSDHYAWVGDITTHQIYRLEVLPPNVPPVASFTSAPAAPVTGQAVQFTDTSTDPDGGTITARSWNFGDGVTSTQQNPSHKFWARGSYTVSLTVTDNRGGTGSVSVPVTVGNAPPVAYDATLYVLVDTAGTGQLRADDADHDPLTYSLVTPSGHGTVVVGTSGSYTYTPVLGYLGDDFFTFKANDGELDSNTATGTVHVIVYQDTMRVSVHTNGTQANSTSFWPSVSGDGRYIAFSSYASNLVSGDTPNTLDVFVHDRLTRTTEVVSWSGVTLGNGHSDGPSISADGRYVSFHSYASNLVPNDNNATLDIFLYDRQLDYMRRVSISSGRDEANSGSQYSSVSGNGGAVAFASMATNLVSGDTNNTRDVFVHFPATGETRRVSLNSNGTEASLESGYPVISENGQYVVFYSYAQLYAVDTDDKMDVYVYDLSTGMLEFLNLNTYLEGNPVDCYAPGISADGRYVLVQTKAALLSSDTNGGYDAYRVDRLTGEILRASVPAAGIPENPTPITSMVSAMSGDGRFVSFYLPAGYNYVAEDTNAYSDIYLRDLALGTTTRVSVGVNGEQGDSNVLSNSAVSSDGTCVAFASGATNLVPSDTNYNYDVFARRCLVQAPNTWPVAADDAYSVNQDTLLEVPAPGVLANDTDAESNPITATVVTGPEHAQAFSLASDGTLSYLPAAGYVGSDSFTYVVQDSSGGDSVATVTITVVQTNWPPVAVDDSYEAVEGTQLVVEAPGVLGNDSDPDGDPLALIEVLDYPMGGDFAIQNDGSFGYNGNNAGTVTFTYRVRDLRGLWSEPATVTLNVANTNDSPLARPDSALAAKDRPCPIAVLDNDNDEDGDTLTVSAVTQPSHGTASFTATEVTYTPASGYLGTDSFTYTVSDGNGGIATGTVSVRVAEPVVVDAGDGQALPGQVGTVTVSLVTPVPDQAAVQTCYSNLRTLGLAEICYANDYRVLAPATNFEELITALLPYAGDINFFQCPYTGAWYEPNPAIAGADPDRLPPDTWMIRDSVGHPDGSRCTVFVDCHVEVGSAFSVGSVDFDLEYNEGQPGLLTLSAVRPAAGLPADWTVEHTVVSPDLVHVHAAGPTPIPLGGTVAAVELDFQAMAGIPGGLTTDLTPSAIDVRDGSGDPLLPVAADAGVFTVTPAHRPPVATGGQLTVAEDTPASGTLAASDPDGDALTFTIVTNGTLGTATLDDPVTGAYTYTPNPNANGSDTFTFKADDGVLDSNEATITVTVTPVNDAPVALDEICQQGEDQPIGVLVHASDVDGDPLTYSIVTNGTLGTASFADPHSPTLTYIPRPDANGTDIVTYQVSDGTVDSNVGRVTVTISPVNDPPVAADDAPTTPEDTALSVTVLANDNDVDGDTLRIDSVTQPAHGTAAINGTAVDYQPAENYNGADSFTYTVSDGQGGTDSATVSITVTPVNDAPRAPDGMCQGIEDQPAIGVLLFGSDVDDDPLTYSIVTNGTLGTASFSDPHNPHLIYTPNPNANGTDIVTYKVSDGTVDSNVGRVTVTISPVNDPPVLTSPGNRQVSEGELLTFTLSATDPDGDPVTFGYTGTLPAGASLTPAGVFAWTPDPDDAGTYPVTFTVSDGSLTDSNTVTITVTNVNRPPVLTDPGPQSGAEGQALTFTLSGSDPDGDTLTYSADTLPAGATLDPATGAFSWTPDYDDAGSYPVTFTASDGTATDAETVTITVTNTNRPPELASPGNQAVAENAALAFTLSASDPDGDTVTYGTSAALPAGATLDPATGAFSWTPTYDQAGSYPITFTASDGTATDTETITITVTNTNRPPVFDPVDTNVTIDEGQWWILTVTARDPDRSINPITAGELPEGATFSSNMPSQGNVSARMNWTPGYHQAGTYSVTFTASDGELSSSVTVTITVRNINRRPVLTSPGNQTVAEGDTLAFALSASDPDGDTLTYGTSAALPAGASLDPATGAFSWTPSYTQAGTYSVTFTASDGSLTDSETITITVTDTNRSPVFGAMPKDRGGKEGSLLSFTVLASDPDGDTITYTASGLPEGASLDPGTGDFAWTPSYTQAGDYTITLTISDGNLSVSTNTNLHIANTNQPPELEPMGDKTVAEGATLSFYVRARDNDRDTVTYSMTGLPEAAKLNPTTGAFSWVPGYSDAGTYTATFTASDGTATDSETITITVTNTNRPPELTSPGDQTVAEADTLAFTLSASDPDGDTVTYSADILPAGATLDPATGAFSWTPDYEQAGTYSVTFTASDGSLTDSQTITITVNNTNRPPIVDALKPIMGKEGELLEFTFPASDPDGDTLTYTAVGLPEGATFDSATGACSWTPGYSQSGTHTVTVTVSDGELSASGSVKLMIVNVNRPPVLANPGNQTVAENGNLSFTLSATDPDGDRLIYSADALPAEATLDSATGAFSWTPAYDQAGTYTVTFTASDRADSDSETVTITVINTTRPPELANPGDQTVAEGDTLTFTLSASDPDGDTLTYGTSAALPAGASLDPATGAFSWTPAYDQAGTYTLTFTVSDGTDSDSETVTITVTNINRPPTLGPVGSKPPVNEGETLTFTVSASDPDGDALTYSTSALPTGASFDAVTRTFTWTPGYDQAGTHQVTFTVSDGSLSDSSMVTISVLNVNRAPSLTSPGDKTVTQGQALTFTLAASDPDGDTLTYSAAVLPTGATLDAATGVFSWTPAPGQEGSHSLTFTAGDGTASDSETITIKVNAAGNTQPGSNVQVNLGEGVSVTFSQVTTGGDTTLTVSTTPPHGPPSGYRLGDKYFDISTTAGYVPPITIRISYNPADIHGNESQLKLFHEKAGGGWEDVTVSVDTVNHVITGTVTSLSWFAIGWPEYTWGGFQPPLAGADRPFKKNSTIPVKFRISGAGGQPVTNAVATLSIYYLVAGAIDAPAEVVSTAAGDVGNRFRYDPGEDQYIFNLSTKPASFLAPYTYRAIATLDDGSTHFIDFSLKK